MCVCLIDIIGILDLNVVLFKRFLIFSINYNRIMNLL